MSLNKNAQLRYNILDECFSNPYRQFFIEDLIVICTEKLSDFYGEHVSVSRRTILNDIEFMKSLNAFDAPIKSYRDAKKVYYRYEDLNFSIHKKPITESEKELLKQAVLVMSRIENISGASISSPLTQLASKLNMNVAENEVISYEENQYLKGLDFLYPLYNYIIQKQVLLVDYQKFGSRSASEFLISPQYLKQYNNRWFLFGINHDKKSLQNIPLDRILSLKPTKGNYVESEICFQDYFDEIVGVTNLKDEQEVEVVLKFTEYRLPYILSKPIHGSQFCKGDCVYLKLKINKELISQVLSFGADVEVMEPEFLRTKIQDEIQKLIASYQYSK